MMRRMEGKPIISLWHLQYLAEILQGVLNKQIKDINIVIPPGHGKTFLIRAFITYLLGKDPSARVMYISNTATRAIDTVKISRNFMLTEEYQVLFDTRLSETGESRFAVKNNRGYVEAYGITGKITGASAELVICDDILDASSTQYVCLRDMQEVGPKIFTRLRGGIASPDYGKIFINQRLGQHDQTAYLQDKYDFNHIIIPFIETTERIYSFGNFKYKRQEGEILNPMEKDVANLKSKIGDWDKDIVIKRLFETQYQQNPQNDSYQIVSFDKHHYYDPDDLNKTINIKQVYISIDTAIKEKAENDYSVMLCFGVNILLGGKRTLYLLDMKRKKVEFTKLKNEFAEFYAYCRVKYNRGASLTGVIVEDTANGPALLASINARDINDPLTGKPIMTHSIKVRPTTKKDVRLESFYSTYLSGTDAYKIPLPDKANWVLDYKMEMEGFPNSKHDDVVDATTQMGEYLTGIYDASSKI